MPKPRAAGVGAGDLLDGRAELAGERRVAGRPLVRAERVDEPQRRVDRVVGGDARLGEVVRQEAVADEGRPGAEDPARVVVAAGGEGQARERDHRVPAPVAEPRVAGDDRHALGGIVGAGIRAMDEEPVRGEDEGRDARVIGRRSGLREERRRSRGVGLGDAFDAAGEGSGDARARLDTEDERHGAARARGRPRRRRSTGAAPRWPCRGRPPRGSRPRRSARRAISRPPSTAIRSGGTSRSGGQRDDGRALVIGELASSASPARGRRRPGGGRGRRAGERGGGERPASGRVGPRPAEDDRVRARAASTRRAGSSTPSRVATPGASASSSSGARCRR